MIIELMGTRKLCGIEEHNFLSRAVQFQKFHIGSDFGLFGLKEPQFGVCFSSFITGIFIHIFVDFC